MAPLPSNYRFKASEKTEAASCPPKKPAAKKTKAKPSSEE